MNKAVS